MRRLSHYHALTTLIALTIAASGCGQVKDRDQKVVMVHDSAAHTQESLSSLDDVFENIKALIKLYSDSKGLPRDGLGNIIAKFKDQLGVILAGGKLTPNDLIELIFKLDSNHDGHLSGGEGNSGLRRTFPLLRWFPNNETNLTAAELSEKIALDYPGSSKAARDGLTATLMRYDEAWAGGNGDGLINRKELATAGLFLSVLDHTDFTKAIEIPVGSSDEQRVAIKQLQNKVNQQVFGRYREVDVTKLAEIDMRLEWMQSIVNLWLVDKLTHNYGGERGHMDPQAQLDAFEAWGFKQAPHWESLRAFYDNAIMGGNGDGQFDTLETFNLITDLTYAAKIWASANGDFSAKNIAQLREKHLLLLDLMQIYPRTGQGIFMGNYDDWKKDPWAIRKDYWDGIMLFDQPDHGGNGDGKLDIGELAMALGYARVVDNLFEIYDTDHDEVMTKEEAAPLFKKLGVEDSRLIDLFFADIGLDGKDSTAMIKLKMFFSGRGSIKRLTPFEFYKRIAKVLPRILKKKDETP